MPNKCPEAIAECTIFKYANFQLSKFPKYLTAIIIVIIILTITIMIIEIIVIVFLIVVISFDHCCHGSTATSIVGLMLYLYLKSTLVFSFSNEVQKIDKNIHTILDYL